MYFRFEAGLHVSQTHCILEDHLYISLFSLVHQQEVRIQLEEAGNLFALTWNEKNHFLVQIAIWINDALKLSCRGCGEMVQQ